MRFSLPSNGLLGLSVVDMNIPKMHNLRTISEGMLTDEQVQTELVRSLLVNPEDLSGMTICDRNYLFGIAMSAIHMNEFVMDVTCVQCSHVYQVKYNIGEKEVITLPAGSSQVISKSWGDHTLEYRILSVEDDIEIVDYALEDGDHYESRYERAFVARLLNFEASDAGIAQAESLPIHLWYSALLFSQMSFHGVDNIVDSGCPECGRRVTIIVPFTKSLLTVNSAKIIEHFIRVSKLVDFKSFLDLSLPEFHMISGNIDSGAV